MTCKGIELVAVATRTHARTLTYQCPLPNFGVELVVVARNSVFYGKNKYSYTYHSYYVYYYLYNFGLFQRLYPSKYKSRTSAKINILCCLHSLMVAKG